MSIAKILHSLRKHAEDSSHHDTDTVRKIVHALDQMEPQQARYTAAYAYILARVANADMNISEAETREMEALVQQLSGMPEEHAVLVVQIAKTQTVLFGGTENFLVTEEFNLMATEEQKLSLLNCLFAVAAADNSVSSVEDREIRLIADELQLRHDQYIDVRLQYRKYLSVLNSSS